MNFVQFMIKLLAVELLVVQLAPPDKIIDIVLVIDRITHVNTWGQTDIQVKDVKAITKHIAYRFLATNKDNIDVMVSVYSVAGEKDGITDVVPPTTDYDELVQGVDKYGFGFACPAKECDGSTYLKNRGAKVVPMLRSKLVHEDRNRDVPDYVIWITVYRIPRNLGPSEIANSIRETYHGPDSVFIAGRAPFGIDVFEWFYREGRYKKHSVKPYDFIYEYISEMLDKKCGAPRDDNCYYIDHWKTCKMNRTFNPNHNREQHCYPGTVLYDCKDGPPACDKVCSKAPTATFPCYCKDKKKEVRPAGDRLQYCEGKWVDCDDADCVTGARPTTTTPQRPPTTPTKNRIRHTMPPESEEGKAETTGKGSNVKDWHIAVAATVGALFVLVIVGGVSCFLIQRRRRRNAARRGHGTSPARSPRDSRDARNKAGSRLNERRPGSSFPSSMPPSGKPTGSRGRK